MDDVLGAGAIAAAHYYAKLARLAGWTARVTHTVLDATQFTPVKVFATVIVQREERDGTLTAVWLTKPEEDKTTFISARRELYPYYLPPVETVAEHEALGLFLELFDSEQV